MRRTPHQDAMSWLRLEIRYDPARPHLGWVNGRAVVIPPGVDPREVLLADAGRLAATANLTLPVLCRDAGGSWWVRLRPDGVVLPVRP